MKVKKKSHRLRVSAIKGISESDSTDGQETPSKAKDTNIECINNVEMKLHKSGDQKGNIEMEDLNLATGLGTKR